MSQLESKIEIRRADWTNPNDGDAIVRLLDENAQIPVIHGKPLPDEVRQRIVPGLAAHPTAAVWLAFDDCTAVGVCVAMGGFSTFSAKPTLNIHDVAVTPTHQRMGIGTRLFQTAEAYAIQQGCSKLTLEVRRDNPGARALYKRLGYPTDGDDDETLFWEKKL